MNLYLEERALKMKISLKIMKQDIEDLLDPLFNRDKIGDRPIMNAEVDKEENVEINHRERHIIKLINDWIKRHLKIDPFPQIVVFHAQACPAKGQGAAVTVPTFTTQSLVRPENVHQLDRPVGYYRAQKGEGKGKRKRNSPQQAKPEEQATQSPPQIGEEDVQG